MQALENFGVPAIELQEVDGGKNLVPLTYRLKRFARAVAMVEERVVEIEKDRSDHRARLAERGGRPERRVKLT
jgi:hypothetical protein